MHLCVYMCVCVFTVTNRDSGNMTFHDMKPGVYTLKVTASDSLTGETSTVERFFEISDHPDFCGLHLINDGLTVSGRSIHVQFSGVPTNINTFRCKLDNKPGFDCECAMLTRSYIVSTLFTTLKCTVT